MYFDVTRKAAYRYEPRVSNWRCYKKISKMKKLHFLYLPISITGIAKNMTAKS